MTCPNTPPSLRRATALALTAILVGCTTPAAKVTTGLGQHNALYDGKSAVAFSTQLPVTSATEAIQRGDLAVSSGDMDKGLFEYVRALDLEEGNPQALAKIGQIHFIRGNQRLAEIAFRWSLQKDPRNQGALTGLGILLLKRRDYAQAKQHLEQAVRIDDRLWHAHNALGIIADLEHDYANAQHHYGQALAGAPGSASLLNNLGYSRYLAGNAKGAIAAFREALLADPNYPLAWRNLALVYTREGRYTDAVDALAKVQDLPKAYNDVGYLAMIGGKLDNAEGLFDEAKRLSADFYTLADTNQRRVAIMQGRAAAP
ncbi:tetratricopeptide repeat protein [uncultured Thiodictyon sp.]|jgi:Flp pilus assembly protein TadD|uniref:tetratricopeptide repeat protein n=1 Tax=uncultured Thiodictyon sp. TaxID=1846217 RepID=UPI0025E561B6|nr:tetratricopeptide repeat protein [uncultured Thiodictyon sp.]